MAGPDERLVRLSEDEAERLIRFYTDAEREILNEINRALLKGNKTEYLKAMQANVEAILKDLREGSRTWCEQAIPRIYTEGVNFAERQIEQRGQKVAIGFSAIHQQAAQVLAEHAFNRFDDLVLTIGRRVDDIYRALALENIRGSVVGYKTWQQVAKNFREQLAERGVTGFRDKAGREWNMRSYTEMVARTTTMEAHLQGTANRLIEHGRDLVKISTHANPCPKCVNWQGKILSLSGNTAGYPTLQEAKDEGLFHPRCKHAYGLFIALDEEIKAAEENRPEQRSSNDRPPYYVNVPGLPEDAKKGLAKVYQEALEYGQRTGRECLNNIDARTGEVVYSRIEGERGQVVFPRELIEFLEAAEADSVLMVHNHPSSSSFSWQDLNIAAKFNCINYMTVIGHDSTRYFVRCGFGNRPAWEEIRDEWNFANRYYYAHFYNEVLSGRMTREQAWKEHSHLILQDVAGKFGWEYRRVMPDER